MAIDKSAIATAPPSKTAKTSTAPKTPVKAPQREESLNGFGQIGQGILIATGQFADAGAVGMHWPKISHELANLCDTQETIAKFIDPLLQVGPYAGLIAAVMPLAMQAMVNHDKAKAGAMGTVSKNMLESKIQAGLAEMELEALKAQQEAEKAIAEATAQLEAARKATA